MYVQASKLGINFIQMVCQRTSSQRVKFFIYLHHMPISWCPALLPVVPPRLRHIMQCVILGAIYPNWVCGQGYFSFCIEKYVPPDHYSIKNTPRDDIHILQTIQCNTNVLCGYITLAGLHHSHFYAPVMELITLRQEQGVCI